MKEGAYEFLQKPVDSRHLLLLVQRALEETRLRAENVLLKDDYARRQMGWWYLLLFALLAGMAEIYVANRAYKTS